MLLLSWFYLASFAVLLGAELNAELERQTARDTTEGRERPAGARGAEVADTVAEGDRPPRTGQPAEPCAPPA
jgi:membrane protein